MSTLSQQLEDEFGSQMVEGLYFDFGIIEAAVCYLKEHQRTYKKAQIKKILDQFIDNHVTNQLDLHGNPLSDDIDYCFNNWWKNQPAPRSLQEQEKDNVNSQEVLGSSDDVIKRVKSIQDDIEIHEQMYGGDDQKGQPFKGENEALAIHEKLMPLFKNCFVESNPIPTKAALSAMGLMHNELRLPLVPASQSAYELMTETIKDLKLL